ncbi:MAG: PD-(D/E)XK nuclease family protein [Acidimicrobiaceae bacterium]|nr:PD-(D/E)XK nuclease family protein [Acidimicrobiaceae bacterium]
MPITLEITGYGEPAHTALASAVERHKREDPLSPVSVIVWSNYMGVAARRGLGQRRGVAAVSFLTPYRLAELLGSAAVAATGRRPISTPILAGAVRAVLSGEPGRFEGVHTHPATERSLVRTHRALSELPKDTLRKLSRASSRTADVVRVYHAVNRKIEADYSNEQDLVDAAVDAIACGASTLAELGQPILFLPQRTNTNQIRLLRALGEHGGLHIIAGASGLADADAPTQFAVEQLGAEWSPPSSVTAPVADRALSVSDPDEEVRHAVRSIVEASLEGIPFNRCAVLYGSHDPYARMIADAFDAADIEWFGKSVQTTESSLMGRALLNMLGLIDHDFSRHDVCAWLASAPVRRANKRPVPAAAWERATRAAGIVSGLDQWTSRLARLVDDLNADAQLFEHDEEHEWRVRRLRKEAAHASELAAFIAELAADLNPGDSQRSWSGIARWCTRLQGTYFGSKASRNEWPLHERRAAERIDAAISRIGDLDGIDPNPSLAAFRRALELQLADDLGVQGTFGHGVLIGPVNLAVGLDLDRVIVLGLAEGTTPERRRDDPLLPDHIRAASGPGLPTRAETTQDTHRALLAVMAAAKHTLFTFPRGDLRRSAQRTPSRWLLDTCEARDGVRPTAEDLADSTGDWLIEVPSFVAGLRSISFPAHNQEYDMRAVLDWAEDGHDVAESPLVRERQELSRGASLISSRFSNRLTRYDGNLCRSLSSSALESLKAKGQATSASRLELWAKCPHAYFVRHILGVNPVEEPEEQYRISPLELGTLFHLALERWIEEARANRTLPAPTEPWSDKDVARLIEIGHEQAARLENRGLVGRAVYWQRDKQVFLDDLREFSRFDFDRRADLGTSSVASELRFGLPTGDRGPVAITLHDGRTINLRGAIDRVDEDAEGNLLVIDYKTGSSRTYKKLDEDPLGGGTNLQLLLYALAARKLLDRGNARTFGSYWFVTRKGGFETHGYSITPELEAEGLRMIADIVDCIESGLFPAHPAPPQYRPWVDCHFCEPDGLGLSHQYSDWLRKSADPELWPYLEINGDDHG